MLKRPKINNEITAEEVRLVDEEGKNLGVLKLADALAKAKEKELDLIEISPNIFPPIVKIMDFGKFLYKEKQKERGASKCSKEAELKILRINLGTSIHDLEIKTKKASEFLKEGHRLRLELFLRGREKYLDKNFLEGRILRALNLISEPYKFLQEIKRGPRGLYVVIEKSK